MPTGDIMGFFMLNILFLLAIYEFTTTSLKNISLCRNFKVKKDYLVTLSPHFEEVVPKIDLDKLSKSKYKDELNEFISVITSNFAKEDLALFYKNINGLKINKRLGMDTLLLIKYGACVYNEKDNHITLDTKVIPNIYHELFHMSSALALKDKYLCGFGQISKSRINGFGLGLDEGYTELLTKRYFGHIEEIAKDGSYFYEVKIASIIEDIVGKDKMEKLYLRADLASLIKELSNYISTENIFIFISRLDFVNEYINNQRISKVKDELLKIALRDIFEILTTMYINKEVNEIIINGHQPIQILDKINKLLKTLEFTLKDQYRGYTYISEEEVNEFVTVKIIDTLDTHNIILNPKVVGKALLENKNK